MSTLIILIFYLVKIIKGDMWPTGNPCNYAIDENGPFRSCSCGAVDTENHVTVECTNQQWITFPPISKIFHSDTKSRSSLIAFSAKNGALYFLNQDAFKGETIQMLDLSHNHIESVNVNAFRGLEASLYHLSLSGNSLTSIPHFAFTHLDRLQYLYLQENEITEIRPHAFNETKLKTLHYLYLDKNKIETLSKSTLHNLPLQVLTLSNNNLREMEKEAIPPSVWFLDLKNNLLSSIPYLSLKDLKELKTLYLDGNNITTFHSHPEVVFENELSLLLSNNKISSLNKDSLASFRKITKLDLGYNMMSTIDENAFASIDTLRELDLSYNRLVNLPINTFEKISSTLKKLNLEENDLHTIPAALRDLDVLETLNMNGNKLASVDTGAMYAFKSTLQELLLAFNRLSKIPTELIDRMTNLRHLDLSKNRITSIEPLAFGKYGGPGKNLIRLSLAGNHITSITDTGSFLYMGSLAYLDLSFNRIRQLSKSAFERLEGLESLFLQNNELNEFPTSALSSLNKLRYLLLDHNRIASIPNFALQRQVQLERLSIQHNHIFSISSNTFHATSAANVKLIHLGHNRITHLHSGAFDGLQNLEQLLLNDNLISGLPSKIFMNLNNLRQLSLSGNRINHTMESAFVNLPRLNQLSLARNRLNRLHRRLFKNVPRLASLDLSHNDFVTFNMEFLEEKQIQQLDLAHNKITRLDISPAKRNLRKLNLNFNQLQFLDGKTLHGLEGLTYISLSHNQLLDVHMDAFKYCPRLTHIKLENNNLRRIWPGTFVNQDLLRELDLSHNFLYELEDNVFGENNVIRLDLKRNNFTHVPVEGLKKVAKTITYLDISENSIRSLDKKSFLGLHNLTILILRSNKIETIEEDTFSELSRLQYLDLSHNSITSWSPNTFQKISSSLKHLNLANTGLFSMPKINVRRLQSLNVSYNKIYEIQADDVKFFKKLKVLDIAYNNIIDIKTDTFQYLTELRHLNISGNRIRIFGTENFEQLYQLESLWMTDMSSLVRIPDAKNFRHLRALKELKIYNLPQAAKYNITQILEALPPLKSIHFEAKEDVLNDQLKKVDARLLREILIVGNNLKKIDMGAFEHLRGFRLNLEIRDTQIKEFPPFVFNTLSRISFLNFKLLNNKIETLNPFTHTNPPVLNQHGTILEYLSLKGNPILCDCRMIWLEQWIENMKESSTWEEIEKELKRTYCSDKAGDTYTLFSVYGQTEKIGRLNCNSHMKSYGSKMTTNKTSISRIFVAIILCRIFMC